MMEGWQQKKISDLGKVITGKTPPTSISEYFGSGYKFITPTDLDFFNYFITNTDREVTELARTKFKNYFLPPHSISFTCIGNTVGKACMNKDYVLTNQQINSIVPNKDNDSKFIYYFLNSIIESIRSIAGGTATPIINKSTFGNLKIVIPPLPTQRKIASILSTYDDLIENNLKRIRLLEEKAQLTYEEWFVRMKFPGHETTPINKETGLPEGWEKVKLKDVSHFQMGYSFKSNDFNSDGIGKKIVRIRNIPSSSTSDYTSEIVDEKYLVQKGDLLVGMDGEFYINNWYDDASYLVQRVCNIQPKEKNKLAFITESIRTPIAILQNSIDGATVAHLGKKHLDTIEILLPKDDNIFDFFQDLLYAKINISRQNQLLKEARDILLPRLMTGMIDVEKMKLENLQSTMA